MPSLTFSYTVGGGGQSGPTHPAFGLPEGAPTLAIRSGFGSADHYMLPQNAQGFVDPRPGQTTRAFYFGNPGNAGVYSRAEIGAAEGADLSDDGVFANWILNQPTTGLTISPYRYGEHPDYALDMADNPVLLQVYQEGPDGVSPWIFIQGGETAIDINNNIFRRGESAHHPIRVSSYGTGKATIRSATGFGSVSDGRANWLFDNVRIESSISFNGIMRNLMLSDVILGGAGAHFSIAASWVRHSRFTFLNSKFYDAHLDAPLQDPPDGFWDAGEADRFEGAYVSYIDGFLAFGCHFDMNGWRPGYRFDRSSAGPQVPTSFSHNLYASQNMQDMTLRDFITSRAANSGAQLRTGSTNINAIFLENNIAHQIAADQDFPGQAIGNYTQILGQFVQGAGCKSTDVGAAEGVSINPESVDGSTANRISGIEARAVDVVLDGLIEAHAIDPARPGETNPLGTPKATGGFSFSGTNPSQFASKTWLTNNVVYRWGGDYQAGALSPAAMDSATIQRWTDARKGEAANTNDMNAACDYLRTLDRPGQAAQSILNFVSPAFGMAAQNVRQRATNTVLEFTPWINGDGYRWDNPRNWSTNDWPIAGDGVNLNGNTVYAYENIQLAALDLGAGGHLVRQGGQMVVTGSIRGTGRITLREEAELRPRGGWSGTKDVTLEGGALICEADITGGLSVDITPGQTAQSGASQFYVCEGASVTLDDLTVSDGEARVGFDGESGGVARLTLTGTLRFEARAGAIATIRAQFSGVYGLNEYNRINPPSVTSQVVLEAGSTVTVDRTGLAAGTYTLIEADSLTDNGATLPPGVSVSGGRVVLEVS